MEPSLTAPGLYLRGVETPPAPPLESGVTGFVGIAERGPLNTPQPLRGWSDYLDVFGAFASFGYLAESVFSFFRNGGEKCWVVRAANTSAQPAPAPGQCPRSEPLGVATADYLDHNGVATMRVRALDPGSWGNRLQVRISTSSARPFPVAALTQATIATDTTLQLDSVIDLRPGDKFFIAIPGDTTPPAQHEIVNAPAALDPLLGTIDLTAQVNKVYPIGSVVLAAGFRIEAEFHGRREIFEPLSMRSSHGRYFARVINGAEPISDYSERRSRGISILLQVEHLLPGGNSAFRPADSPLPPAALPQLQGGGDGFTNAQATFLNAALNPLLTVFAKQPHGSSANGLRVVAVPFATATALPVPDVNGASDRITVDAIEGFQVGETVRVRDAADALSETATVLLVVPAERRLQLTAALANAHPVGVSVGVDNRFTLEVHGTEGREPLEVIENLSGNSADPRFVRTVLAADSARLCADDPPAPFATVLQPAQTSVTVTLAGGSDPGDMDARYYTGYEPTGAFFHPPELPPEALVGLATLEDVPEVSLTSAPDMVRVAPAQLVPTQTMLLRHCARLGDRFALLDPPREQPAPALTPEEWVAGFFDPELRRFGAAFHPWISSTFDKTHKITPPTGFLAGLFARSDVQRGVAKAPANEVVKGAFGLHPSIDQTRQGELNPLGVNCVRKLEDGEVRLMGSRTLSADPKARYISITRTVLALKKSLARDMLWSVFEPIGPALFQRIESTLTTLLQSLVAKGVTASQRPGEAFYVKCNDEVNPPEQQRLGIVVAEIGIALLAPAEFLVITVRRTPDAVQVIEEEV